MTSKKCGTMWKNPSGSCGGIFDRQKRRRTTTTSKSKSTSKVKSMGHDPGWCSKTQKARKHGPKMVATQEAIQTNLVKTDRAEARAKVRVESEEVPQVESPEKGHRLWTEKRLVNEREKRMLHVIESMMLHLRQWSWWTDTLQTCFRDGMFMVLKTSPTELCENDRSTGGWLRTRTSPRSMVEWSSGTWLYIGQRVVNKYILGNPTVNWHSFAPDTVRTPSVILKVLTLCAQNWWQIREKWRVAIRSAQLW